MVHFLCRGGKAVGFLGYLADGCLLLAVATDTMDLVRNSLVGWTSESVFFMDGLGGPSSFGNLFLAKS